jgi:DNA-cytosine methyltransferase
MNVLSLFDGMSCGQIALERAGIPYDNYYASEIDKYAIKVTQANFPNTIQLGDVTKVFAKDLPKIDLLIGGSPCTGFSMAGKGLNFEDPQSKLFFEYVRLLRECAPDFFLLENVRMKKRIPRYNYWTSWLTSHFNK